MAWSKEDWYEIDEVLQDIAHLLGKIEREERKQERQRKKKKAQTQDVCNVKNDNDNKAGE